MPDFDLDSKPGNSPVKIALAALLTVVFVVVLIIQFGGESDADDMSRPGDEAIDARPDRAHGPRRPNRPRVGKAARKQPASATPSRPWPVIDPSLVLKHDPFSLSAIFSIPDKDGPNQPEESPAQQAATTNEDELQRKRAAQREAIEQLRQQGYRAIFRGGQQGGAALLGSQVLRVGDEVSGHQVIAIGRDGVVLQPPAIQPPQTSENVK